MRLPGLGQWVHWVGHHQQPVPQDIRRWKNCKLLRNLGNAIKAVCGPHGWLAKFCLTAWSW